MNKRSYSIEFPKGQKLTQDRESVIVEIDGKKEKIHFHDYDRLYAIPWLYDRIFDLLGYQAPATISNAFSRVLCKQNVDPSQLRVLEPGAGCGIVAEHLRKIGIARLVGLDIRPSARAAAQRDKPGLYEAYYVADLTQLSEQTEIELKARKFNCVVVVSATGWSHLPVAALDKALELLVSGGWLIYHTKRDRDGTGGHVESCQWLDLKLESAQISLETRETCLHRYSIEGQPIYYELNVCTKNRSH